MIRNLSFAISVLLAGTTFLNANDVGKWSLNDSATATSALESINSFNASEEGDVTFEKDGAHSSTGTAVGFDGSSILEVPYNSTLNPNGSFSISAWVKPSGGNGTTRSFVSSRAFEKNGFIVRIATNNKFRFYVGDGEWRYVEGPTASLGQWYHVLATFESRSVTNGIHKGVAKIFVNGKLAQFKTLTYKPNSSTVRPLRIGGGGDKDQDVASTFNFVGDIDEVEISSGLKTVADYSGFYNLTTGVTRELYYDIPNHGVHLITTDPKYPWHPDVIDHLPAFEFSSGTGDKYGARTRAYITIPEDADYRFHFASDDRGELLISLDGSEQNLQRVAHVTGYTGYKQYDKYPEQTSSVISLTAGQVIYAEAFVKEHGGGDHLAVAWSKNGGAIESIPASQLVPFTFNVADEKQELTLAIQTAQNLYDQSAANIGTGQGQYSESSRINYNVAISQAQSILDNETDGRSIAYAKFLLDQATETFTGGVKPTKILGTPFGTTPAWLDTRTFHKAHDGDVKTFFDFLLNNGGFTGIEVPDGRETAVLAIRFHPRYELRKRMVGGKFQGSLDGETYTDLHTITEEPTFEWHTVQISDSTPYKFLRYLGPSNSHSNIAELEFHGLQNQELFMLSHEIISVAANIEDQALPHSSLTAEHGGLLPHFITYKVLELPVNGTLKLNGTVLAVDSTFTQQDLNNGLVTFSANDSRLDDSFKVEISTPAGGLIPELIVDLLIDSDFDGLSDQQEIALGTDYDNADTNGNGISDAWEHENGMDPVADTLSPMVDAIQGENGLSASYIYGRFSKIADFASSPPAKVTKISQINFNQSYWKDFANSGVAHNVGAKFTGYLYVPVEGNYKFILSSDDGSDLYIDGIKIINNDGAHSFKQVTAVVNLSAGFHPIRCNYFEAAGHHGIVLQWEGPGRPRQVIPSHFYFLSLPDHEALELSIDSDQDGLTDLLEGTVGSDPENPDTDGDRLLDGEEYHATYGYQTLTTNVDTDGDTVSDYDEIFIFKSNPLVPDFDGSITEEIVINPMNTSKVLGRWFKANDTIMSQLRRGAVEYKFNVNIPGLYRLDTLISQAFPESTKNDMELHIYLDGEYVNRQTVNVSGGPKTASWLTTYMKSGEHTLRIFWENVYLKSLLQINAIKFYRPGGPDENENGRPDWVDSYLDNTYSLKEFSSSSKVSPAQIEGKGRYITKMSNSLGAPIKRATHNNWFADLNLSSSGPTDFTVEFEEGLDSKVGSITWEETNVLDGGEMTVRQNSKLRLNAVIDGDTEPVATVKIGEDEPVTVGPENPLEHLFDTPGTYEVVAEYQGSENLTTTLTVKVVGVEETASPFMWRTKPRFWNWPNLPEEVSLEAQGMEMTPTTDGFTIKRDELLEEVNIVARLGEDGPIISSLKTEAFSLRDVVEGFVPVVETFEDGTKVTNDTVFGVNIPAGMVINVNTISGVTFPNGSRTKNITKADFNHLDEWVIELHKTVDRTGASCHWYKVYQNGIFVGQQNK